MEWQVGPRRIRHAEMDGGATGSDDAFDFSEFLVQIPSDGATGQQGISGSARQRNTLEGSGEGLDVGDTMGRSLVFDIPAQPRGGFNGVDNRSDRGCRKGDSAGPGPGIHDITSCQVDLVCDHSEVPIVNHMGVVHLGRFHVDKPVGYFPQEILDGTAIRFPRRQVLQVPGDQGIPVDQMLTDVRFGGDSIGQSLGINPARQPRDLMWFE